MSKRPNRLELAGKKFNRLLVIEEAEKQKQMRLWKCLCDCGKFSFVQTNALLHNRIKSCGCLASENLKKIATKHGKSYTKNYNIWRGMRQRCLNEKSKHYSNYGGRGIKICDRWLESYDNFLEDMGDAPNGKTLERVDNDKEYSRKNCIWASRKEQGHNRRTTHKIIYEGKEYNLYELWEIHSKSLGLWYTTIRYRYLKGMDLKESLTLPSRR